MIKLLRYLINIYVFMIWRSIHLLQITNEVIDIQLKMMIKGYKVGFEDPNIFFKIKFYESIW